MPTNTTKGIKTNLHTHTREVFMNKGKIKHNKFHNEEKRGQIRDKSTNLVAVNKVSKEKVD